MNHYDMIVIGTGCANIVLEAAQLAGKKCAQIERGKFGGTCLTRGCIPTKVLVTAADRLYEMREANALGLHADGVGFDWDKIRERVWHKIDDSVGLRLAVFQIESILIFESHEERFKVLVLL